MDKPQALRYLDKLAGAIDALLASDQGDSDLYHDYRDAMIDTLDAYPSLGADFRSYVPVPSPTGYLVVGGSGQPEAIDPYMYGDNGRAITAYDPGSGGGRFVAVVTCWTSGGFAPQVQADRLGSGLYGAKVYSTLEAALSAAYVLGDTVGVPFPAPTAKAR